MDSSVASEMKEQVLTTTTSERARVVCKLIRRRGNRCAHAVGVDLVLGAAEGDEGD